jgi:putative ABC transport system permease protein
MRLALKNISGNAFRSWIIVMCAFLVGGLSLATVLVARQAADGLLLMRQRLGADIVVVRKGAEQAVEGALLVGSPVKVWIPVSAVQEIAAVPGVTTASPQLYLVLVPKSPFCSAPAMFVVAYDPATDFTIQPWLKNQTGGGLNQGEVIGGTLVSVPASTGDFTLYGYSLTLKANLESTGTALDRSMFVTFETARDLIRLSGMQEEQGFAIPDDSVSSVMVKVAPGVDAGRVALEIEKSMPGVTPVKSPDLFGSLRNQMEGQRKGMLTILGVVLALSLAVIAVVFSMAVNERRREIGVLRALGATRGAVLRSLLTGAAVLALSGGLAGIVVSGLGLFLLRHRLMRLFGFPFLFPSLPTLLALVAIGLAAALAAVLAAAFIPAYRVSRQEPAVSMRE